jgi:hypothetical protein
LVVESAPTHAFLPIVTPSMPHSRQSLTKLRQPKAPFRHID